MTSHPTTQVTYQRYDEATADTRDRIAWKLCQIIDDDAPLRWTWYRFAAECIATNSELLAEIQVLRDSLTT